MLDSLKGELQKGDAVTIVFDGKEAFNKSGFTDEWLNGFQSATKYIVHEQPLGFWGHAIRNEYQGKLEPATTFVMHADDDDRYKTGAFNILRSKCKNPECLYIAKMKVNKNTNNAVPRSNRLEPGNIGTPNGIIPFSMRDVAKWEFNYGGDYAFYSGLASKVKCIERIDDIIYESMHNQGNITKQ
jgi:hypothetical protein